MIFNRNSTRTKGCKMNDRFKFRVWNQKHNFYCNQLAEMCINYNGYCFDNGVSADYFEHDGFVIEQCTGLKDKNGNLIFEGDIVKIGNGSVNGEVIESDLVVEWICKNGRYNLPTWTSDVPDWSHYVEIIGNIHEQTDKRISQH